jgi:hypothetical protein
MHVHMYMPKAAAGRGMALSGFEMAAVSLQQQDVRALL